MNHIFHPEHLLHPTEHEGEDEERTSRFCKACFQSIPKGVAYSCKVNPCDFHLHRHCAESPNDIRHPFHHHPLTLSPIRCRFQCSACNHAYMNAPSYTCSDCNFNLNLTCAVQIPRVRFERADSIDWQHIYFEIHCLFDIDKYPCEVCHTRCHLPILRCFNCDGNRLHLRHIHCLPRSFPSTVDHRSHYHTLSFKEYFVEDDSGEYYCDICEKPRHANYPVYCCKHHECRRSNFIAHVECVIGSQEFYSSVVETKNVTPNADDEQPAQRKEESSVPEGLTDSKRSVSPLYVELKQTLLRAMADLQIKIARLEALIRKRNSLISH